MLLSLSIKVFEFEFKFSLSPSTLPPPPPTASDTHNCCGIYRHWRRYVAMGDKRAVKPGIYCHWIHCVLGDKICRKRQAAFQWERAVHTVSPFSAAAAAAAFRVQSANDTACRRHKTPGQWFTLVSLFAHSHSCADSVALVLSPLLPPSLHISVTVCTSHQF